MLAAALVLVASGCASRSDAQGAGEDVDACAAYPVYDSFDEPSPRDAEELLSYSEAVVRVVERVEDFDVPRDGQDDLEVPKRVLDAYAAIGASMKALRDGVQSAGRDPAKLAAAAEALGTDRAYLAADELVATFYAEACPRG